MLQDPKEIVKIWTEELTKASTEIVSSALRGEDIEKTPIAVTILIPDPLLKGIIAASKKTGTDPDEILSRMASQGFQKSIDEKLMMGRQVVTPPQTGTGLNPAEAGGEMFDQLKGLGVDMSGLQGKMGQLGELMNMLNGMKEQMDNAADQIGLDVSKGEDTKNT